MWFRTTLEKKTMNSVDIETVRWVVGGLLIVIVALVGIIWMSLSDEMKKSRHYRHYTAPAKFAEIDSQLIRKDSLLQTHDRRLTELEHHPAIRGERAR